MVGYMFVCWTCPLQIDVDNIWRRAYHSLLSSNNLLSWDPVKWYGLMRFGWFTSQNWTGRRRNVGSVNRQRLILLSLLMHVIMLLLWLLRCLLRLRFNTLKLIFTLVLLEGQLLLLLESAWYGQLLTVGRLKAGVKADFSWLLPVELGEGALA